jgi:hypothetical protein
MRIALELRVMAGSDMIMGAQAGNVFGTASIEVITTMPAVDDGSWAPFAHEVARRWMAYNGPDGEFLNTRPHWAKEWDGIMVRGKEWKEVLKETYKSQV